MRLRALVEVVAVAFDNHPLLAGSETAITVSPRGFEDEEEVNAMVAELRLQLYPKQVIRKCAVTAGLESLTELSSVDD